MSSYKLDVKLSFIGSVEVEAESKYEAQNIVRDNLCAMLGRVETNNCPLILDWNIDPHSSATVAR